MKKKSKFWRLLLMTVLVLIIASSCSKSNDSSNPAPSGTVTDIDGNVYHTVTIGTQVWMVENLKTTKYRNGDLIPNVTDGTAWNNLTTGAQCNYNNDATNGTKYGKLYNWYAVSDSRKIAPTGWHVPTDVEWATLKNYATANFGTSGSASKALAAKTDWASDNGAGSVGNDLTKNNTTGFTALPGGCRGSCEYMYHPDDLVSYSGYWWSQGECYYLLFESQWINAGSYFCGQNLGFSVRCIRD